MVVLPLAAGSARALAGAATPVDDFIVGDVTYGLYDKRQDFVFAGLLVVLSLPLLPIALRLARQTLRLGARPLARLTDLGEAHLHLLVLAAAVAVVAADLPSAFFQGAATGPIAFVVELGGREAATRSLAVAAAFAALLPVHLRRRQAGGQLGSRVAVLAVTGAAAAAVLVAGAGLGFVYPWWMGLSVLAVSFALASLGPSVLDRLILVMQIPLPLVWLGLLGYRLEAPGAATWVGASSMGLLLVGVAVVAMLTNQALAARQAGPSKPRLLRFTGPAIVGLLLAGDAPIDAFAMGDEFHVGEIVLPFQQLTEQGATAFAEFVPIPGLAGWLYGAVNDVMFGGGLQAFPLAYRLTLTVAAAGGVLLVASIAGRAWGAVLAAPIAAVLLTIGPDRALVPLLVCLTAANPVLLGRPTLWFGVAPLVALVGALLMPTTGIAAAVAVAGVGLWLVVRAPRRHGAPRTAATVSGVARTVAPAGAVLAVALAAGWKPLLAMVAFVRHEAQVNTASYALGLWQRGAPSALDLLGDLVRFSAWLVALPVLLWLAGRLRARITEDAPPAGRVLALTWVGVLAMTLPYALGRIDGGHLSRPGMLSMATMLVVLPCVWAAWTRHRDEGADRPGQLWQAVGALMLVGVASLVVPTSGEIALALERTQRPRDGDVAWTPAESEDQVWLDPEVARRLDDVAALSGERYWDMTGRNLQYAALGAEVGPPLSQSFYAAYRHAQLETIEALRAQPVPVVFEPNTDLTAFPAQLRAYRVFRWLVESGYHPASRGRGLALLPPGHPAPAGARELRLSELAPTVALAELPRTLGLQVGALGPVLGVWRPVQASATAGGWRLDLSTTSEPRPDVLLLRLACDHGPVVVTIEVAGSKLRLRTPDGGRLLVPLGVAPGYLVGSDEQTATVTATAPCSLVDASITRLDGAR
ncbi:MAG: hypothetical protein KY462_09265 [Actinobacteria bacterium]|nr:hypothetical protein [Actinomycetota bacterium]